MIQGCSIYFPNNSGHPRRTWDTRRRPCLNSVLAILIYSALTMTLKENSLLTVKWNKMVLNGISPIEVELLDCTEGKCVFTSALNCYRC